MRLVVSSLMFALALAGCSSPSSEQTPATSAPVTTSAAAQKPASTGAVATTSAPASAKPEAPSAPTKVSAGAVRATRCNIGNLGAKYRRSLHVDAQGTLYAFDDGDAIHKIPAGKGPCGLGDAVDIPQGDKSFLFTADGGVQTQKAPDEKPDCASLRVWSSSYKGAVSNGVAFVVDDKTVYSEDLKSPKCDPKKFGDPAPTGNPISIAASDKHVFVLDFHGSGHDDNYVFRYDRTGKLVDKVNVGPEGKAIARWPDFLSACGPGVCLLDSEKTLVVFGADGKLQRKADIEGDGFTLGYASIAGMVEIPGKGLFLYVGLPKEKGSSEKIADIVRIESYAK
ncbi:MAG: hypothetical protein U0441_32710 [Polyangiaceae bacterium]